MSTKQLTKSKKGFTIIEVVLVLAIAGLIFLMVFVALPALQRNQRDTQRRQDYADLASNIINRTTNNNGNPIKTSGTSILTATDYVNSTGKDPQGNAYRVSAVDYASGTTYTPQIGSDKFNVYVLYKAKCSTSGSPTSGGNREFIVYGYLESGGNYCGNYSY